MIETTEMKEPIEQEAAKPYSFRKLSSADVFPMFKIIGKIGVNEFTACFEKDEIKQLVKTVTNGGDLNAVSTVGIAVILEIANVIFNNIPKCENEIYQLLAQTSNLEEKAIREMDFVTFTEMVIDFVKKDEFPSFIKVVSKLFK